MNNTNNIWKTSEFEGLKDWPEGKKLMKIKDFAQLKKKILELISDAKNAKILMRETGLQGSILWDEQNCWLSVLRDAFTKMA